MMQKIIAALLCTILFITPLLQPALVLAQSASPSASPVVSPTDLPAPAPFTGTPPAEILDFPVSTATLSATPAPTVTLAPTLAPSPAPTPVVTLPEDNSPVTYESGQGVTTTPIIEPSLEQQSSIFSARIRRPARVHALTRKTFSVDEQVPVEVDSDMQGDGIRLELVNARGTKVGAKIAQHDNNGTIEYELAPKNVLAPGKYTLNVYENDQIISTQDFLWGVLAINTNKSMYAPGDQVHFALGVLDEQGDMVCDALVTLEVTDPSGDTTTFTTSQEDVDSPDHLIRVNPSCVSHAITLSPDYEAWMDVSVVGKYAMKLTATTRNGAYAISDSFDVDASALFDVERQEATRIFPPHTYPVRITMKAKQDFTGDVVETVPAGFTITQPTDARPYDSVNMVVTDPYQLVATSTGQLVTLGMPFVGGFEVTQGYSDPLTDPYLITKYESFGLTGHDGVDFGLPDGTPVYAVDDGVVVRAENEPYGLTVILQHDWGRSYYGHLSLFAVQGNQTVRKGTLIGYSGQTGLSTGPHLHFGMRLNEFDPDNGYYGKIDPAPYLAYSTTSMTPVSVKKIHWQVTMKKGEELTVGYQYHAPHESPQFYLTGPLTIDGMVPVPATAGASLAPEPIATPGAQLNPFVLGVSQVSSGSAELSPGTPITFSETRQWQIASDSIQTFTSVGVTNWNVPTGITSIRIKAWGGGGGGGGGGTVSDGGEGGGAAFATGLVSVTAGEQLNIRVGGGGGAGLFSSGSGGELSGDGAGGGARSYVQRNSDSSYFTIAGGGGGGGGGDNTAGAAEGGDGGPGGTTTGTTGTSSGSAPGGGGGTQAAGGSGGASPAGSSGQNGGLDSGGHGGNPDTSGTCAGTTYPGGGGVGGTVNGGRGGTGDGGATNGCGGGGGGANGYYGGGGGAGSSANNSGGAGGGGGSSYLTGTETSSSAGGSGQAAGGNTDEDYVAGTGTGGNGGALSGNGAAGNAGRVVIWYSTAPANPTQIHYRWRNDDGNETAATWAASQDSIGNVPVSTNKRLRIEISNEGDDTTGAMSYRLEVSGPDPSSCAAASYTRVDSDSDWDVVASSNITDGAATTNVASGLTDENTTFVAGQTEETSDQLGSTITITERQFTEIEYVLQANGSATLGAIYCFRLTNAGSTSGFTYSAYAQAQIQLSDNPTQQHYRWRNDDGGENPTNYGDGADGALAPAGSFNLNTGTTGSRTRADGIAYRVNPPADGGASSVTGFSTTSPNDDDFEGIAAGDEVLLINMQGTTSDNADVGNYEFMQIQSVDTGTRTLTFTASTTRTYDGTTAGNQKVFVQRVPNYTSVTLDSTDSLVASEWDAATATPTDSTAVGRQTGIVAFRASGTVSLASGTSINVDGLGYQGGAGGTSAGGGTNGESYDGTVGAGGNNAAAGTSGGGAGSNSGTKSQGTRGGGGGGGGENNAGTTESGGGGAGGGYAAGGGGGGAGADNAAAGNGGSGGTSAGTGGGGGGSTAGDTSGGAGGNAGSAGGNSGDATVTGGAAGSGANTGESGASDATDADSAGAGGGGGGLYGDSALADIFLGSGGGGGGDTNEGASNGAAGGDGGGIVIVIASTLTVTSTGAITSDGEAGSNGGAATAPVGGGGGGAGGSLFIRAGIASLGSNLLTATGGAAGTAGTGTAPGAGGGGGGIGRIRVETPDGDSVTTNPAASTGTFSVTGGATWYDSEDAKPFLFRSTTYRLRLEMSSEGSGNTGAMTYRLEVSGPDPTNCASASYTRVDSSSDWDIVTSSNFADGDPTSNIVPGLTDENTTFVAGQLEESTDTLGSSIDLTSTQFTEMEYAIQPTSSATGQATYCFRLTNSGSTTHFTYATYAEAQIASPLLTQVHYRWRYDDGVESGLNVGDGADGALAPSGTFNLNTGTTGSRTYADGIVYKVDPQTATTSGSIVKLYDTPNGLAAGDDVLLINLQGATGDTADVGKHETFTIQSVNATSKEITFMSTIANSYDGSTPGNQRVLLQRIPNYTTVTLDSSDSLTATAWDGLEPHISGATAYYSGIVAIRANSGITVGTGTSITASSLGYRGGTGSNAGTVAATNGESYDGTVGAGGVSGAAGSSGGGAGSLSATNSQGTRGGGGAGGSDNISQDDDGGGGGAGGGYGGGGGGGGGGGDCTIAGGDGGSGGSTGVGGGGGGGADDCVTAGDGGAAGSAGTNALAGAAGTGANTGEGGGSFASGGRGGGGGGGGGTYGSADLSTIFLGSGGGGGGGDTAGGGSTAVSGSRGGGIVILETTSVTVSGTGSITSGGGNSSGPVTGEGAGGAGAGGSILIQAGTVSLGTNLVTATGGSASSGQAAGDHAGGGGGGGVGRIRVEHNTGGSVTTNPTASESGISGGVSATWANAEDTRLTETVKNTTYRMRIEMSNEGQENDPNSTTYRLEVSQPNPQSCSVATYTRVTSDTNWALTDSSYFDDGDPTTNAVPGLTDENTSFVSGQLKDTGDTASAVSLTTSQFAEYEFAVSASTAVNYGVYCFRLTNAGSTADFSYSYYAEIYLGPQLSELLRHGNFFTDNTERYFSF